MIYPPDIALGGAKLRKYARTGVPRRNLPFEGAVISVFASAIGGGVLAPPNFAPARTPSESKYYRGDIAVNDIIATIEDVVLQCPLSKDCEAKSFAH